jgi:hypothetical protein
VIEPPPRVTIRSARASRACTAAAITALRVRRHGIEGADAVVAERAAQLVDFVGGAVERAAHHQEDPFGATLPRQRGDGFGGRLAVDDLFHLAENDLAGLRHGAPPMALWLLAW